MYAILIAIFAGLLNGNPVAKLPPNAKTVIDSVFLKWSLQTGVPEYQQLDEEFPASACQKCYVNNDTIPDYVLHIKDSLTIEHIVVLLSEKNSYRLVMLQLSPLIQPEHGDFYVILYKAGYKFWVTPFEDEGDLRKSFPTDCIGVMVNGKNICDIFLFEKGKFKSFSPCE